MIILNPDELKDRSFEMNGVYQGNVNYSANDIRRNTMLDLIYELECKKKFTDTEREQFLPSSERKKILYYKSTMSLDEISKIYGKIKAYKNEDLTRLPKIII